MNNGSNGNTLEWNEEKDVCSYNAGHSHRKKGEALSKGMATERFTSDLWKAMVQWTTWTVDYSWKSPGRFEADVDHLYVFLEIFNESCLAASREIDHLDVWKVAEHRRPPELQFLFRILDEDADVPRITANDLPSSKN